MLLGVCFSTVYLVLNTFKYTHTVNYHHAPYLPKRLFSKVRFM